MPSSVRFGFYLYCQIISSGSVRVLTIYGSGSGSGSTRSRGYTCKKNKSKVIVLLLSLELQQPTDVHDLGDKLIFCIGMTVKMKNKALLLLGKNRKLVGSGSVRVLANTQFGSGSGSS